MNIRSKLISSMLVNCKLHGVVFNAVEMNVQQLDQLLRPAKILRNPEFCILIHDSNHGHGEVSL